MKLATEKTYRLVIPRPQYDRLGNAEVLQDDTCFRRYDPSADTTEFVVTESQRARFARNAVDVENSLYWICQMFREDKIHKYIKG
jgi:hypothetical protein